MLNLLVEHFLVSLLCYCKCFFLHFILGLNGNHYDFFYSILIEWRLLVHLIVMQCLIRCFIQMFHISINCIGGVMVCLLASSAVDCGFEPWWGQTKDYEIGICCFPSKHAALRRKSKDRLARNRENVSEWGNMSISWLLLQWASTIKMQLSVLV